MRVRVVVLVPAASEVPCPAPMTAGNHVHVGFYQTVPVLDSVEDVQGPVMLLRPRVVACVDACACASCRTVVCQLLMARCPALPRSRVALDYICM